MNFVSVSSEKCSLESAIHEVCDKLQSRLEGRNVDLAILLISSQYSAASFKIPDILNKCLNTDNIIGCSCSAVINGDREYEGTPAITLMGASMPDVKIVPFEAHDSQLPDADAPPQEWHNLLPNHQYGNPSGFLLFSDPYTVDTEHLLLGLDYSYPQAAKFGGLVAGMKISGQQVLFVKDKVRKDGIVGVGLFGNIHIDTITSHSCSPVGPQMVITAADKNNILELDGEQPVNKIGKIFDETDSRSQDLMRMSLQIGFPVNPLSQESYKGEFFVRNVIGINGNLGSIRIGREVHEGQVVQFHILDNIIAETHLKATLEEYLNEKGINDVKAALLFSCITRGKQLFKKPNTDSNAFQKIAPEKSLSGAFLNGQISSHYIAGTTKNNYHVESFLHGYTATFTMLKNKTVSIKKYKHPNHLDNLSTDPKEYNQLQSHTEPNS